MASTKPRPSSISSVNSGRYTHKDWGDPKSGWTSCRKKGHIKLHRWKCSCRLRNGSQMRDGSQMFTRVVGYQSRCESAIFAVSYTYISCITFSSLCIIDRVFTLYYFILSIM